MIELVIVIGILSVILVAVGAFQFQTFRQNQNFSNSLRAEGEARLVLRSLIADLRSASPSTQGAYPIAEATKNTLIFYSDRDRDNKAERWRYYLEAGVLYKGVTKPTAAGVYNLATETVHPAVRNIVNSGEHIFNYYDESFAGTSTPLTFPLNLSDVRLVQARFEIDANPAAPPLPTTYQGEVMIRNLKSNL